MSRGSALPSSQDTIEFASYVAALTSELSRLAREHQLPTLAYLLDIARLEANSAARGEVHMEETGGLPAEAEQARRRGRTGRRDVGA
jgi:hypothetical protein